MSHPVLRPKPDVHRMYAQEQFVIHTARIIAYQNNQCMKQVLYYDNIILLLKTKLDSLDCNMILHMHNRAEKTPARIITHQSTP
jgi:hypothetical protein